MKYNKNFIRDYEFYLKNINVFTFSGGITKDFVYSESGYSAKDCFYIFDSQGKKSPCKEIDLLYSLLNCKAAVNLQIKVWAEAIGSGDDLFADLLFDILEFDPPDWVLQALINKAKKIINNKLNKTKFDLFNDIYMDKINFDLFNIVKQ